MTLEETMNRQIEAHRVESFDNAAGSTSWRATGDNGMINPKLCTFVGQYVGLGSYRTIVKCREEYFAVKCADWSATKFDVSTNLTEHERYGHIVTDADKEGKYLISESNLHVLTEKIEKLNRRADKLSLPRLVLTVDKANPVIRYLDEVLGKYGPVRVFYLCSLAGVSPRVNGFQLVAKLEGTEHGNLIKTMLEDEDLPVEFRDRITCDHCNTNRYRINTYVLRDQSGELKQVGSNCLADYLRSEDHAEWLAKLAELREFAVYLAGDPDADSEDSYNGRALSRYFMRDILELAASAVRCHGWVSGKKARESNVSDFVPPVESTADKVKYHLAKHKDDSGKLIGQLEVSEDDKVIAASTLDWLKVETGKPGLSDYMHNCRVLIACEFIEWQQIGILVSTVATYTKAVEKQREIAASNTFGDSNEFLGKIGDKLTVKATLVKVFNYEVAGYGYRSSDILMGIHIFRTSEGNTLVWKTQDKDLKKDIEYTVTGTIKAHETYKGTNQTVLTRCKLESESLPPELCFLAACDYRPASAWEINHVDGRIQKLKRDKWVKEFKALVSKHGKPTADTSLYRDTRFKWGTI